LLAKAYVSVDSYPPEVSSVDESTKLKIGRRDLFRVAATAGAAAVAGAASPVSTTPPAKKDRDKRKSQYQPNAPEVRTFYRVNSYPAK
jgi:hypothetical protein